MDSARGAACTASLLLTLTLSVEAQEQRPGTWGPWREGGTTADVPAAAVPVLRAHSDSVLAVFRRAVPELGTPDASWWGLRIRHVGPSEDDVWTEGQRWPMRAGFYASIIRSWRDDGGRVRWEPTELRASIGVGVATNSLKCVFPSQNAPPYQDDAGPIYEAPALTSEVGGFPVYNTDCLAITRREQPLFLPATRERVGRILLARLRATLADFDRGAAEMRAAGMGAAVAEMQDIRDVHARAAAQWTALLAGMSPAERNAPAHLRLEAVLPSNELGEPFAEGPGENVISLVYPNPGFFDLRDPTGIQLVTIGVTQFGPLGCTHPGCEADDQALFARVGERMDWNALAALTVRRGTTR